MATKNNNNPSRREFIAHTLALTGGAFVLNACGSGGSGAIRCATNDTLSRSEMLAREGRNYVEVSGIEDQNCLNCEFFEASESVCGTCRIDSLAANPSGHCVSWTALQA